MTRDSPGFPESLPEREGEGDFGELDRRMVRNSAWITFGHGGGQVIGLLSMLVLARLLDPSEFGVVAIGYILIAVLTQVQGSGLGSAYIHLREDTQRMASSAFLFAAASGTVFATVVALAAPVYTRALGAPEATDIVRALGIILLFRGLAVVPGAIVERNLDFRPRVTSEFVGYSIQATTAIVCAVAGLGAWSLVYGQLAGTLSALVVIWALVEWRPSLRAASRATLRSMMRYGRFVSSASLVEMANQSVDRIFVARLAGTTSLGAYTVAWRLAEIPNLVISPIVGRVLFSTFSSIQEDRELVRRVYVQSIQRIVLLALPATLVLGLAADPLVPVLLGDNWLDAEILLRILAGYGFVRLIGAPSGELLRGIGRPGLRLALTVQYFATVSLLLALLVPPFGATGAAVASLVTIVIGAALGLWMTFRLIGLSPVDFGRALARPVLCSVPLAVAVVAILGLGDALSPAWTLVALAAVGSVVYVLSVVALGRSVVTPILAALRPSKPERSYSQIQGAGPNARRG